jgi:hypothetical protein
MSTCTHESCSSQVGGRSTPWRQSSANRVQGTGQDEASLRKATASFVNPNGAARHRMHVKGPAGQLALHWQLV